jgi:hypothetical protein
MDRCPICDVAVKPENLLRHLSDTHPRHPDTARLLEELKTQPGRMAARAPSRPFRLTRLQAAIIVIVILLGVGAYLVVPYFAPGGALPCVSGEGRAYHWHTDLTIKSGGNPVTIPGGIGISLTCMEILHTHDANGRIHIEPDTPQQSHVYSIGEFFRVWGKPFGSPTRMLVNGTLVPTSQNVGLYDLPNSIEIDYASFTP